MPAYAVLSNRFKLELGLKTVDLDSDSIKCLLMKSGFVFDPAVHGLLANIKADTTAMALDVDATARTFTRASGSFITDGFVPGNNFDSTGFTNAGNNGAWVIDTVVALVITVVDGTGLVTESGGGDEQLVADDELETGNGYTQNTKTTGTITAAQNDTANRAEFTFPTVLWEASGGSIGPTPCLLLYDDTHTSNVIVGAYTFISEMTATDGEPFEFANGSIYIA